MPTLHPHIESLSSIKVFPFGGQHLSIQHSFRDLIVLKFFFNIKDKFKACYFIDSELKEINPIYESFKRITGVYCNNYKEALEVVNMLKQASIQEIDHIRFWDIDLLEDEQITDQLLNYKIHSLIYSNFS